MKPLALLVITTLSLILANGPSSVICVPTLQLDPVFSPPAVIPTDPALMDYNAPEMDHMLEPIKVQVLDDYGNLILDPVLVTATTILTTNWNQPDNSGDTYTGTLCQHTKWSSRFGTCRFRFDDCIEMTCNTTDPAYPLGKVEVESVDGVATFERLLHTEYSGANQRRIRFYADVNGTTINTVTNAFDVTLAAAKLEITSGVQADVFVNEPMTFTVQTMAVDPADPNNYIALTTGRHSILNVDLTIVYDYKQFYIYFPSGNFNFHQLAASTYTLGGSDVIENGYFDLVIRKQCSSGLATFSDVRILTEATNIQLNFTQTLSYHPWERWPPVYNESWVLDWTTWTQKTFVSDDPSPAVAFTNAFNVTLPVMNSLAIESTSLSNFVAQADANFPFKTPLVIQALDTNSRVITDGPDSMVQVSVEVTPPSACISVDSNFTLSNGVGTFPGSICEVGGSVTLRFYATDNLGNPHYTVPTPTITVSGEFRVAGIYPIFADVTTDLLTAAAVELINEGVWEPDFKNSGRSMVCQYYFASSSDVQETLRIYDEIYTQNTDSSQSGTVRAIIGSVTEEDTISLSTVSKRHEMPIMGYVAESGELSDKSAHPYFNRVSYSEGARYYSEGAYMASHRWDKVIVIKDSGHPIPVEMYNGFEAHGIKIVLEATIPSLSSEPSASDLDNLPHLYEIAEQILAAGTRLIYTYTYSPTDIYLYEEAILHGFAPIDGFQWMGNSLVFSSFPLNNDRGHCLTHTPTCTAAFNSTINMAPTVIPDLWSGYWGDHLYYTLTNLDPTLLPGSTIYRWPEVLGAHSKGHDAAVAVLKGAMKIINDQETITGPKLAQMIRTVNFTGGTGFVSFDANGDRPGYSASVYNFNPISDPPGGVNDVVWTAAEWTIDPVTLEVNERQFDTRTLADNSIAINTTISYAPITYYNQRDVLGYAPGSDVLETLAYDVPAMYWCSEGCGGGLASDTNGTIYIYNYGTCESQDNCICKNKPGQSEPGYAGSACQQILCDPQCRNGECVEPDVCECEPYWTGQDCGTALCTVSGCNSETGNCTGPNICTCLDGYWGSDCAQRCTCKNGVCNDGQGGTGTCASCNSGYAGANCDVSIPLVIVPTFIVVTAAIVIIVLVTIWYIKRMKFRAALANNDWIVTYSDVVITTEEAGANSMAFRSMVSLHADQQRQKNVVRNQGKWNGVEVAIKMLDKDSVIANTQQRLEIKAMRDIRHNNLTSFIGACLDSPNVCILMETAPKGSLDDILSMGTLQLDWNFKYSLLKDICRGMTYLANSPIKSHGRLKSSNCVIDNRWTLKITDYGMQLFKSNQNGVPKFNPAQGVATNLKGMEEGIENSIKAALLYTAPEFLRQGVCHPDHVGAGSIQGDMYSLGIIMSEVLTSDTPFYEFLDYVEVQDVVDAIAGRVSIKKLLPGSLLKGHSDTLRPTVPDGTDPKFAKLMQSTWIEDPMQRPTFQQVLKELNSISPQKGDLMDNLVNMLEKYSTNLEAVVAERTQELAAEKAKTDELVCRMLPRAIAEQLMRGETVSAETFECVTIYFSDIVGFTKIAGGSTPMQVVDLLNDLYTCFDAIIDHFDVYKVETIGDAYMVVSGLPLRNGDQHAGEIASMSLHLLSAIMDFRIRHMPEERLQLRIGIHSGPVVAGVVGLKMPRYCLFGDTVNTASRMESGGLALKIHMSDSTAEILEKLGGYHLQRRGEREVKGKGIMTTYWLKNMDGFNRALPSDDMAVSESQHEFK